MFISVAHAADAAHGEVGVFSMPETWVAIAFLIVVGFAFKPVFRGITAGLDMRREKIRARIEDAQRLREEAQDLLATYQRKQRDALKEAEEIIEHAKAEAQRMSEQAARDLEETLKRREQQAMDRIAQAEARAMREVRNAAVDVAMAATKKLIGENLSAGQSTQLIDDAIAQLQGKLH